MNLRDVKYLLTVAETCHFGRAAERCFVSQPTLSGQIKKLEEELNVVIFERTNRSVTITPIGERILVHARLLMEQVHAINQLAHANQDPLAGFLRLGIIPTLSPYLLPLILKPLQRLYPKLKLVLSEDITDNLLKSLHNHEIDAALLATVPTEQDLSITAIFEEPFWFACPQGHPLGTKETIYQNDLDGIKLLLLTDGHCLTQQVMKVCHNAIDQQSGDMADLRATSLETLLHLVEADFGCTLVPALAVKRIHITSANIILRPLNFSDAVRHIQLVYRSSYPLTSTLFAFADVVRDHLPSNVNLMPKDK